MTEREKKEKELMELIDKNTKLVEEEIEKLDKEIADLERENLRKKMLLEELKKIGEEEEWKY